MKFAYNIILIAAFAVSSSIAQRVLTLNEALSIAMEKSYGIRSAAYELQSSEKSLEAIKLGLMTTINLQFDIPRYARTLSSEFDPSSQTQRFYDIGYTTYEGRLLFTQPIIFTNGTFSLAGSIWKRNQFSAIRDIPIDYYSNISLRLRQPLFTFNTLKANLKRSEINLEKSKRNYSRAEKELIYNVTAAFYHLYQAKKNFEIAEDKVAQSQISYNTAVNKFKAGLIAEVEALQLEIDLASSKNDLLNAERNFNENKDDFKLLIGLDIDKNIDIVAKLNYKPVEVDLNTAITYALKNRTELQNAQNDIDLKNLTVDEVDSKGNISAMLTANYGINKNDNNLPDIFHDFAQDRSLIFTLSVPVLDWGRNRREVEAAKAELNLSELYYANQQQSIKREIISVINKIKSAKARVDVLSKNVELAQKSYDISLARFESGNITSFDLSQMQLRLTDAKINSLNALIDYKLAIADLTRKTLHNFESESN